MANPKDDTEFNLAVLDASLSDLEADVKEIKATIRDAYVKRMEFEPVRWVVYGLIGIVLLGASGALGILVLVFR